MRKLLKQLCVGAWAVVLPALLSAEENQLQVTVPAGGLYPHGDIFPIGGYGPNPMREKEAGFSFVGPHRRSAEANLEVCRELQIPMIYPLGVTKAELRMGGENEKPKFYTYEELREILAEQMKNAVQSEWVYAWNLHPEELRSWRKAEIEYLELASKIIRELDPMKRPVWMYEPGHRTKGALEKTILFQQIAGKGVYTNYSGYQENRSWVSWTLDQQNQAIAAVNPEMLPFAVLEMFQQPSPENLHLIPTWVRHDSYAALLEGVKGIVIFSFGSRSGFPARMTYYNAYAQVARELNGELGLGAVFLRGEEQDIPAYELVSGNATEILHVRHNKEQPEVEWPTLKIKSLVWKGYRYLFLVNSSQQPLEIRFHEAQKGKPLFEGQPTWERDLRTLQLPPLGVAAFKEELL